MQQVMDLERMVGRAAASATGRGPVHRVGAPRAPERPAKLLKIAKSRTPEEEIPLDSGSGTYGRF